jgi:hypothetical protein
MENVQPGARSGKQDRDGRFGGKKVKRDFVLAKPSETVQRQS